MSRIKAQLWLPSKLSVTVDMDPDAKILPNFKIKEIANNLAKDDIKLVIDERAWKLLDMLQLTRHRFGIMDLNSVYRTKSFNSSLKYADPNSAHLRGWAFDWLKKGQKQTDRNTVTQWWKDLCSFYGEVGAINWYTNGYHCEIGSDICYGNKAFMTRDYRGKKGDW